MTRPATDSHDNACVGRLAPSPTGQLHLGNLSTSLLAWVQVRAMSGRLLLRIEDLDGPRVKEGAAQQIIDDLAWLGLDWDVGPEDSAPGGGSMWQSQRSELYANAAHQLLADDAAYLCTCSRRDVQEALSAPHGSFDPATRYPGTCAAALDGAAANSAAGENGEDGRHLWRAGQHGQTAVRFRCSGLIQFDDALLGLVTQDIAVDPGDIVILRKDGLAAYQLAVVVDDAAMGVTHILRGADLLPSTAPQLALFDALGAARPQVAHAPMVHDARGERLSKRHGAIARAGLQAAGWSAAELRGAIAFLWGWLPTPDALEMSDLLALGRQVFAPSDSAVHKPTEPSGAPSPGSGIADTRASDIKVPDAFFDGPAAFRGASHTWATQQSRGQHEPPTEDP